MVENRQKEARVDTNYKNLFLDAKATGEQKRLKI